MSSTESKKDNPKMIIVSDILGCQHKLNNESLTRLICKPRFFNSLNQFLKKNNGNKISFVGNFFDKGSNVISTISQIINLYNNYEGRVNIILSHREIQKLRFKFELDKTLLEQGINKFPGKENLEIKKIFVPVDSINDANFDNADSKKYINAVYTRINDIITKTHDGNVAYGILIHECLMDAHKNAKRQGYMELVIMTLQLGSLLLVYPFLTENRWRKFLTKGEVKYMIEFLVKSMKTYFSKFCSNDKKGNKRTDPVSKELNSSLECIYGVIEEYDESKFDLMEIEKLPPLDAWDKICNSFFGLGSLMTYDSDFSTLLCHDYALVDFFKIFRLSYSLIVKQDNFKEIYEMEDKSESFEFSYTLYYEKMYYFYELYNLCYNELVKVDVEKFGEEEKKDLMKKITNKKKELKIELCGLERKQKDLILNYSQNPLGGDDIYDNHVFQINNNKCEKLGLHENSEGDSSKLELNNDLKLNEENNDLKENNDLNSNEANNDFEASKKNLSGRTLSETIPKKSNLKLSHSINSRKSTKSTKSMSGGYNIFYDFLSKDISEIDIEEYFGMKSFTSIDLFTQFLNQCFDYIFELDIASMDQGQMDNYLFIYVVFLRGFNKPRTFLDEKILDKDNELMENFYSQSIKCLVVGNVESGCSFPVVIEHKLGDYEDKKDLLIIAPNISKYINSEIYTPKRDLEELEADQIDEYSIYRQKNYPLSVIENDGKIIVNITSLLKTGLLDNNRTYLGEYMAHTFVDHYLSHHFLNYFMRDDDNSSINIGLKNQKVLGKMLPSFDSLQDNITGNTFFIEKFLFIKIEKNLNMKDDTEKNSIFFILYFDLKKDNDDDSKVYYYFGDIATWDGYLWNSYTKTLEMYLMDEKSLQKLNERFLSHLNQGHISIPTKNRLIDASTGLHLDIKNSVKSKVTSRTKSVKSKVTSRTKSVKSKVKSRTRKKTLR